MNSLTTILDLFGLDTGACCRGGVIYNNPVLTEGQNLYLHVPGGEAGVRAGAWIGFFSWLLVASPAVGYLFGKIAIANTNPAWGFWTVMILASVLLVLVVVAPEVRPPWRIAHRPEHRSAAKGVEERGELKLVMFGTSPGYWWEEVWAGMALTWKMLHQKGFLILAVYFGLVFGHLMLAMMVRICVLRFGCF